MERYEKAQFNRDNFLGLSSDEKRNLSEEDIRAIFADDNMTLIMKDGESIKNRRVVNRYRMCLAKLAQPSPDGKFLVLPEGLEWGFETAPLDISSFDKRTRIIGKLAGIRMRPMTLDTIR